MAFRIIPPISGAGQISGSSVLRGNLLVEEIVVPVTARRAGIEIQFFSATGDFVGMIGSGYTNAQLISLELIEKKIGGLESFSFSSSRDIDIPFANGLETRFYINGFFWYAAELIFKPNQDRKNVDFPFEGKGYSRYFGDIVINKLYENKTLDYILTDIIQNELAANSPVFYNGALISPPSITVTKLELNDSAIQEALDTVLKIANNDYSNNQYRFGVNKYKEFFFEIINPAVEYGFFEGYQYQEPDIEINTDEIINEILIYRALENQDTVEYVATEIDTPSQEDWGVRSRQLTIDSFVDSTTASNIANSIIQQKKDPITQITIDNLLLENEPYEMRFYHINNKQDDYSVVISEFDDLSEWTLNISNTTVVISEERALTGTKSFKCTTAAGSSGEYIEIESSPENYFVNEIVLYVNQDVAGTAIQLSFYDVDNTKSIVEPIITTSLVSEFIKISTSITDLKNIKKTRITFITNSAFVLYLDRLQYNAKIYKRNELVLDEITYVLENASFKANAIFGEETANILNDIEEIDEKTRNVINIFQKQ